MHARIALGLAVASLSVGLASPAVLAAGSLGGTSSASCAPLASTCTVSVGTSGSSGSGGGLVTCTWTPAPSDTSWPGWGWPEVSYGQPPAGYFPGNEVYYPNVFYGVVCTNGYEFLALVWPSVPGQAGQQASSELQLPLPQISTSPASPVPAVINLPVYLTVNAAAWQPVTATANIGGISATATATPDHVQWRISDGKSVSCPGAGVPYNGSWGATPPPASTGACTYTFAWPDQTGNYSISATVYYHVTWTSTGVAGGGDLGLIPGPTATVPVTVDQIRSIVTG